MDGNIKGGQMIMSILAVMKSVGDRLYPSEKGL